jgi:beta-mannosidase
VRFSLDGPWQLTYFLEGSLDVKAPEQLAECGAPTVMATVPGDAQLDLVRAGVLPDPFVGPNIRELRPYEFYEWWYTRGFELAPDFPAQGAELVCQGLDCVATVWVNGREVGRGANMLVEHVFPLGEALRPGANQIAVRLGSPLNEARRHPYEPLQMSWERRDEAVRVRKAAQQYGWDICPRLVTAGIWRSMELVSREPTDFEHLYFRTAGASEGYADLAVHFQFRTDPPVVIGGAEYEGPPAAGPKYPAPCHHGPDGAPTPCGPSATPLDDLKLRMTGHCGDSEFTAETPIQFTAGWWRFGVPGAKLWWPRGYGEANLYDVRTELLQGDQALATREDRIGLRTLELIRPDDGEGEFLFRVNGEPIMVKGSNWVPLDAFHSRDAERYEAAVELFADLGCNMIRCWGGNVYEDHRFFDLCDEHGIMVWQDFSFACCRYPQDEGFLTIVRDEARKVVRKLRHHPSLAVWCGDNEIDMAYICDGLLPEHNRISREVLPQVVHECDPWRPYVPSSPYLSPSLSRRPNGQAVMPEQHLWGPRDYFKSRFYTENTARFIGEMGYHGCPNVSSLEQFLSPEALWPWQDNEEWLIHSVEHYPGSTRNRIQLMADQVQELFGFVPDGLYEFALASQISQAEAKKFFVEHTRLRKFRCSGILWWNVLDCWPQFSDAIVDYYFGRKLAYHYLRRVQRPVCVMIGEPENWHVPVVVGNDTRREAQGWFRVENENGGVLAEGEFRVAPNANRHVAAIRVSRGEQQLLLVRWEDQGQAAGNHYAVGSPPFDFGRYRAWLEQIAALPEAFDASAIAR